jgi:hypothetical protein
MDNIFSGAALTDATKRAIYDAWGATLRSIYPTWGGEAQAALAISDANMITIFTEWGRNETAAAASYGPISGWDTSKVTSLYRLCAANPTFNGDISKWNVASATTFEEDVPVCAVPSTGTSASGTSHLLSA